MFFIKAWRCGFRLSYLFCPRGDPVFMIGLLNTDIGLGREGAAWKDRYLSSYTFRELSTGQIEDDTIFITLRGALQVQASAVRGLHRRVRTIVLDLEEHAEHPLHSGRDIGSASP